MPHSQDSEASFRDDVVEPWLRERHPDAEIDEEHWVSETGAFADYWVDLDTVILAVEVGNDGSIRDECAQAFEYAGNDDRAVPVVIVPEGHSEPAVVQLFRALGVVIHEL